MTGFRERKLWVVFFAILLLFAACKGETPTAPPTGGGTAPPGTTPPPTGVSIVVAVSNTNPVVDSSVTITATVTENGQPVANGTAVEFTTNIGVLSGGGTSGGTSIIRTTTNGVATVTLTSAAVGTARVTVTVNNVSRQTDVSFGARPVTPTPPNLTPSITGVSPNIGRPAGGETIRITGTNFRGPVRVFFRFAGQVTPVEASVVAATETTIDVVTPGVNLGVGQQVVADIIVITQAGSATENRAESTGAFTFRSERLTPVLFSITPNSGPVLGSTRVTLIGDGFQEPVQVLFGTAEARVIKVDFDRILVDTPPASSTPAEGSGTVVGAVDVIVRNLNSQTSSTLTAGFNYKSAVTITTAGPTEGPFTGGTRVEIDGTGFVGPVAVSIGGVAATPIFVSGSKIIALTSGVALTACADVPGPIIVTNSVNGDSAIGPNFIYRVIKPVIVNVSSNNVRGGTITVTVANAIGTPRLRIGNNTLIITGATDNGDGTTTYTATVPSTLVLNTQACPTIPSVSIPVPTSFDVTYTSLTTTCTDTITNGVIVSPPANTPVVVLSPAAFTPFTARITPATADPDGAGPLTGTPAFVTASSPQTLTVTNSGTGTLTINSVTPGAGCGNFAISAPPTPTTLEACDPFPVTAVYNGTMPAGTEQCVLTIGTSAGNRTLTLTGTSQ